MECPIIEQYFLAHQRRLDDEKQPRDYGAGELLHHGEINFLQAIYRHPDSTAAQLAAFLDVTRGAVTQWGNKLEDKGLCRRLYQAGNKKEKRYSLTPLGQKALRGHQGYHRAANQQMCRYLSSLSDEQRAAIVSFLQNLAALPISEYECENPRCLTKKV